MQCLRQLKLLSSRKTVTFKCAPQHKKNGAGTRKIKVSYEDALSLPGNSSSEQRLCHCCREDFEEVGLTSRNHNLAVRTSTLPEKDCRKGPRSTEPQITTTGHASHNVGWYSVPHWRAASGPLVVFMKCLK